MTAETPFDQFDLISTAVFVLELNQKAEPVYVAFNTSAQKLLGRPLTDYLGHTALTVYPQDYGHSVYARHCKVCDSGTPLTYQLELPLGGKTRTIRTTLCPKLDNTGKVTQLFGSFVDITSEISAQVARVQFDTLASEMEQFVALAAHDLRAPMRNITIIADMLREDFVDHGDGKIELLDTLDNIAEKSMGLIADVLLHVETVKTENSESVFSFPALCRDIRDTLDPSATHKISTSNATISADRTAMQIALRNLTDNAIKHGGRDCLDIRIDVRLGQPGLLEITLSDNGKGFPKDALKIMNTGRVRAQSGYGLFAIKRLISARGGTLVAHNLPDNNGAVVQFSLPGKWIRGSTSAAKEPPTRMHPPQKPTDGRCFTA